ncbi:Emopamil binding protein-domain-containing protein [Entophlyctis helioformis]|nr:Emopamil binding protein-domain-containing protein [Entophlyctis helioformis]
MTAKLVPHPFHPRTASIPHYTERTWTAGEILGIFFGIIAVVMPLAYVAIARRNTRATGKPAPFGTRLVFLWFLACGCIHLFVEGWFAATNRAIAGESDFLSELWKEYAMSDSRYMTSDPFVTLMESMTAFAVGPLSFIAAALIYANNPYRHLFQFAVSLCQLYGDVLYYGTTLMEGAPHCDPHPYYFWFYFVFMNAFWIVIPILVMMSSGSAILRGLAAGAREDALKLKGKSAGKKPLRAKEE